MKLRVALRHRSETRWIAARGAGRHLRAMVGWSSLLTIMRTRHLFIVGGILLALGAGCDEVEQAGTPGPGTGPTGSAGTGTSDTSATTSSSTTSSSSATTSGSSVDTGSGGASTSSATSSGSGSSGGQGGQGQGGAPPQPDAGPGLPDGAGGAPPGIDAMPPAVDAGPSSITGKKGLWDLPGLLRIRGQAATGTLKPAYDALIAQAETAMTVGPFSVMDKTTTPPSGDKHDYTGMGRYFWPDPTKPNGLPYISRDGESNPDVDSNKYDYRSGQTMASSVTTLGLAYFLSRNEKYAQKAHDLLKVWYIDAATKMNPNLNYAQSVPGVATGRKEGIIDTLAMAYMIDSLEMLKDSPAFTAAEFTALNAWFTSFLGWLRTSAFGMAEEATGNNHASYYDVQAMRYAIYLGNTTLASQLATMARTRRVVDPDQPRRQPAARDHAHQVALLLRVQPDRALRHRPARLCRQRRRLRVPIGGRAQHSQGDRFPAALRRSRQDVALPADRARRPDPAHPPLASRVGRVQRRELRAGPHAVLRRGPSDAHHPARLPEVKSSRLPRAGADA